MVGVTDSLSELFIQTRGERSYIAMAEAAGLLNDSDDKEARKRATDMLGKTFTRKTTIQWSLVNYILQQTLLAGNPLDRARADLTAAGLDAIQAQRVIDHALDILGKMPPGHTVAVDRETGTKTYDAAPASSGKAVEAPAPYGAKPIEERRAIIDRSDELKRFRVAKHGKGTQIPKWLDMAAGSGTDLERATDYIYFEELKDHKGVHSAVVKGDSMTETIKPGSVIVMKEMPTGSLELPQIEEKKEKTSLTQWKRESQIQDGDIAVVSINGEAPTLKRIVYDTERGEKHWKMQIIADNARAWRHGRPFQVAVGDKIVFHARLIGIAVEK